jgi:hypothetical protein
MIRYRLVCKDGHEFDGWFKDSRAYDAQAKRGLVTCADCGTKMVEKALMAPSIGVRQNKKESTGPGQAPNGPSLPAREPVVMAPVSPEHRAMLEMMRAIRKEVVAKAEYVGDKFADEARKIHYDETDSRGIYGEATREEAEALIEEGIGVLPLPVLPEDRN